MSESRLPAAAAPPQPALERSRGRAEIGIVADGGRSRLAHLFEQGCSRLRLPRSLSGELEAVLINTGGGLAGGDRLDQAVRIGDGSGLTLTTQAAEKVYRARGEESAVIASTSEIGAEGRLAWLPQETILFDGARLERTLEVRMAASARLLALETLIFGRAARGEVVARGSVRDRWRIEVDGRLVWLDPFRIDGPVDALLARPAIASGARALATLLYVGPDAAERLPSMRELIAMLPCRAGVSLRPPVLAMRLLAARGGELRRAVTLVLRALRGVDLPRVWLC